MGSMVIKIDKPTGEIIKSTHHYSDIDVFQVKQDVDGDVPMIYDVEAVKQSIRNILMWRVGESVLHPEFGHNIHRSMYAQMDGFNQEKISNEIKRAIDENEPRVILRSVSIKKDDDDEENNAIHVKVSYVVKGNNANGAELVEAATIEGK